MMGPESSFNPLGAGFILFYLVLMLAIGWMASRGQRTSEDFLVAGRSIGLVVLVLGNVAAMTHGGAVLSHIAISAQMGGVAATTNLAYVLGFAVILFVYAKKLRNSRGLTLPDYMSKRFDSLLLRGWGACVIALTSLLYLVGQINVMGYILESLVGFPIIWGKLIGTLIFIAYVAMGGLLAVIWTNIAQFFLMWAGVLMLIPHLHSKVGGWSDVLSKAEEIAPGWSSIQGVTWTWGFIFSWYILVFVAYSTRLELVTKLFAARDVRVARFSIPATALLIILFLTFNGIYLGGAARILVWDDIATPDQAFPALVALMAGPWLTAFALTAVASATMSTTDSLLLMSGASISHDLIRKCFHEPRGVVRSEQYYLRIVRYTILIVGALAFGLSLKDLGLIWEIISYSFAIVGGAFFFPLIVGMLSKSLSWQAALASSVSGALVAAVGIVLGMMDVAWALIVHPVLPALAVSATAMVLTQYGVKMYYSRGRPIEG